MKKNLTLKETIAISSMLFGMFFGAGNLIFPVHLGQLSGYNVGLSLIGFIITGVGLPLLGVVAFGKSKSTGLYDLASRVDKRYAIFFTCLLTLTIGPFFAIPRCATTSFTVGLEGIIGSNSVALFVFSLIFFALVLFFSLKPNGILTWIGKILNPLFLIFLVALIIVALVNPLANVSDVIPDATYLDGAFTKGFFEGYNTMDALASLVFGIIVVNVIIGLGIKDTNDIARNTAKAGIFSCLFMGLIYAGIAIVGTQSRGLFETSENGGIALSQICTHYFGSLGQLFLAITVTLACLKTAIGLVTSIGEAFDEMFTKGAKYKYWAIGFTVFSFLISNVGLSMIIKLAIPVLMFTYPLAITLILLGLFGNLFDNDKRVYLCVTIGTLFASIIDFINSIGGSIYFLPLSTYGLGWVVPSILGLVVGLILKKKKVETCK